MFVKHIVKTAKENGKLLLRECLLAVLFRRLKCAANCVAGAYSLKVIQRKTIN